MPRRMQKIPESTTEARLHLLDALVVMEQLRARPSLDPLFQEWLDKRMGEIEGMVTVLEGIQDAPK